MFSTVACTLLIAGASGFHLSAPVSQRSAAAARASALSMGEEPVVKYGEGSGWKPTDVAGSKHTMSGGFESTDTPDFFDEDDEYSKKAKGISFTDGIMGSQAGGKKPKSTNPGVEGALDVNPDIYIPEAEASRAGQMVFELKSSGMTDQDFAITCDSLEGTELVIPVRPVCMTFEDFYCGFTADSHQAFSVSPSEGKMERRNGPPTQVKVTVKPSGRTGELTGYLCFILPEEKSFSTYYKITCNSR